ncbi:MAG: prepilin-type N-terminal cleavage/methylation domain-containing protein [Deltaproteobacteria bacterium]
MKMPSGKITKMAAASGGFTLLEIMLALLIISIGIVSVVSLSRTNLKGLERADDQIESSLRAAAKMREVLNLPSFKNKSWSETDEAGYTYEVTIHEIMKERTDALPVIMNEITVTAFWTHGENKKRLTLKTARVFFRSES